VGTKEEIEKNGNGMILCQAFDGQSDRFEFIGFHTNPPARSDTCEARKSMFIHFVRSSFRRTPESWAVKVLGRLDAGSGPA
jgi:hypothetical protein